MNCQYLQMWVSFSAPNLLDGEIFECRGVFISLCSLASILPPAFVVHSQDDPRYQPQARARNRSIRPNEADKLPYEPLGLQTRAWLFSALGALDWLGGPDSRSL